MQWSYGHLAQGERPDRWSSTIYCMHCPGPPLSFSPGWQNVWAFGPKSQSDAEYLCITDRAGIHDGALDSRLRRNDKKTSFLVLTKLVGCKRRIPDEMMLFVSLVSDQNKKSVPWNELPWNTERSFQSGRSNVFCQWADVRFSILPCQPGIGCLIVREEFLLRVEVKLSSQ
jgi:hypothetical protein